MDLAAADQVLGWGYRGIGALYAVGGAFVAHNMRHMLFLARSMDKVEQMMREADQASLLENDPEDRGRFMWLFIGGVLTFATGLAMLAGSNLSVYLLLVMIAHQAMYLSRQHKRIQAARTELQADDAVAAPTTWNAFGWTFPIFGLALYLAYRGVLT
ncbi:MAG: hypothetical protein ABWZ40_01345 [Caulobacterales bacterium]